MVTPASSAERVEEEAAGAVLENDGSQIASSETTTNNTDNTDANKGDAAQSSSADEQDAKKELPSLYDVVKKAASPEPAEGESSDPAKKGAEGDGESKSEAKPDGDNTDKTKAEADDSKLPFHKHPRWIEVLGERDGFKAKVAELEPAATEYGKIQNFMQQSQLTPDEVGEGFVLMAMMKHSPEKARPILLDYAKKLGLFTGEELPDDLRERIESGEISEELARDTAKTRAKNQRLESEVATTRERTQTESVQREQRASADLAIACQSNVAAWENRIKSSDPDYAKKAPAIVRFAKAIRLERGDPKTAEDAVAIVQAAYDEVNKTFADTRPSRPSIKPLNSDNSSKGAKAVPTTLAEAVRQAAAGG